MSNPNQDQIPTEVYAVAYQITIHHEADEESRRRPGHGYPAYSEDHTVFKEFANEAAFLAWVAQETRRGSGGIKFRAYKCKRLSVDTEIKVSVRAL